MEKKPTKQKNNNEDKKKSTNGKLLLNGKYLYSGIGIVVLFVFCLANIIMAIGVLTLLGFGAGKFNKYLEGRKV
jgi:hypothetical protein